MSASISEKLFVLQQATEPTEGEVQLADKLHVSLLAQDQVHAQIKLAKETPQFALTYSPAGLCLAGLDKSHGGKLLVDFNSPQLRRRLSDPLHSQQLGKAVGLNKTRNLRVLDGSAGFATDAFLLAAAGCRVTALERSLLVYELVKDAIDRLNSRGVNVPSALQRLVYQCADFLNFSDTEQQFDVVYLDPMFPEDKRTAKSKKSMHFLQTLLEKPSDETQLIEKGLQIAHSRVVVKRGRRSPLMGDRQPNLQLTGKSNRFDVYFPKP